MAYSYKAFLFDFDGVVVDTEGQYTSFWAEVNRRYIPQVENLAQQIKGNTIAEVFERYFPSAADRRAVKKDLEEYEGTMSYPYISGAERFISALGRAGVETAVVTSSDRAKMEAVYRKRPEIRGMFSRIFTAEDFSESKPSPDCYISAAHRLGFEPWECVVAEDSLNGLRAARASGAYVVGLLTTNARETVEEYSDAALPDFESLTPDLAERLFREWQGRADVARLHGIK